eukprot:TRINITY_DN36917_c0_g1_i1.p1 TRINITY_DN36917_c0_g1~~TRINITY_DN36917_c0_g1_i1.p1  ORF type:complete len:321 (+),score=17.71 TRINITY_DN36917_c0_g1_i1:49-1011(+)
MLRKCVHRLCAKNVSVEDVLEKLRGDGAFAREVGKGLSVEVLEKMEEAGSSVESTNVPRPSRTQMRQVCIRAAVPFLGFGIFDNLVMLTVGDAIDATFGVSLGFSTLAAAGFGQCVSDSFGVTLQGFIERFSDALGLPNANLSRDQERLSYVKSWVQIARTVGIVLGCLLGMFPLFFLNTTRRCIVDVVNETLPPADKQRFDDVKEDCSFEDGEKLLECGTPSEYIYIILQGEVNIIGRDNLNNPITVCSLGPGNMIGELEAVNDHPCVADVVASDHVKTQRVPKDDFIEIIGREPSSRIFNDNVRSSSQYVWYRMKMDK